ncbi:MAG TPA: IS21 family transposase [Candidatus Saccharimonadales bacterium]|nr:IS21 family transposase [Candidatus Saccharimonadales bacterium]
MEILEAFDLTQSCRTAAELVSCSHHTVAHYVDLREAGKLDNVRTQRARTIDPYLPKVEEWVEMSRGKFRADVAHERLLALGYGGSERTTRRALAEAKKRYHLGHRRVYRPWVPEPGMWFQWDYGWGPLIDQRQTLLFCAWLAWSRHRVILPIWDKTLPSVVACIDTTLRRWGGSPTYGLTDNEKTVTSGHVAGIPIRNQEMAAAGRHYGLTIATCIPADPESKGGSEATVRIAKADLVPTEANLLSAYPTFGAFEAACEAVNDTFNSRVHRVTRRVPDELLAEERQRLHPLPEQPFTLAFGQTRTVGRTTPMVDFDCGQYSAPHYLAGEVVWARSHGDEVVLVHVGQTGPVEVARHPRTTPGNPRVDPAHFPPHPEGALARTPSPTTRTEAAFLALGTGAQQWLLAAAAAGVGRIRVQLADAVTLAALHGTTTVDRALALAASAGRFAEADLGAILAHQASAAAEPAKAASEQHSLQSGTAAWAGFGQ